MTSLKSLLPILGWAPAYTKTEAQSDLVAAVIVTIMLVPQSLAYAMLAGLPPQVGLYASILPLIAYAVFGTSRALAVGPVAVVSLMTAAAVGQVAAPGSAEYLTAAITLAFLSGLVLVAMSVLRLGFMANFLSHPVISGFITASGILIATSQLKHILGIKADGDTLPHLLTGIYNGIGGINPYTLVIGVAATAFLFWTRKQLKPLLLARGLRPRVADLIAKAGPVAAIVLSILAVVGFGLVDKGVKIVGDIPAGLPPFALPSFDLGLWQQLLLPAVLISLVGFVESVSVAQTLAAKRRQRIVPNQELTALGASNIASALSGVSGHGGFARSVVNFDAGAETPLAGAFTAAGILAATVFLTPLFRFLPQAVLAATIVVAVLSLVDIAAIRRTWAYSKADFAAMAVTILTVLGVGVEAGITAGVSLSLLLFLWRTSRPHMAIVGQVPGTEHFRNVDRHEVITDPSILSIRVDESLYFANARALEDAIYDRIADHPDLKNVILMCPAVNAIDASALESLEAIAHRLGSAGIGFHLSEVKGPVMDALKRSDFMDHFKGQIFLSQFEAVSALSKKPSQLRHPLHPEPSAGCNQPRPTFAGANGRGAFNGVSDTEWPFEVRETGQRKWFAGKGTKRVERALQHPDYLFGTEPAAFLRREANRLATGQTALCVADGEGRNSVFLAAQGLAVTAMDASDVAVGKARVLAKSRAAAVDFHIADIASWDWGARAYDVVAAIFIQFAGPALRDEIFAGMVRALAPGGLLLLHGYTPAQLAHNTGGPRILENLYTADLLSDRFNGLEILHLAEYEAELSEGSRHVGQSALIDFVARKPL